MTTDDLATLARENAGATGGQVSAAARRWVDASHRLQPRQGGAWTIVHRLSRQIVGTVMYFTGEPGRPPEISYMIAARWRRKGLGGEALAAVLAYLFEDLALECVFADVALDNDASVQLLRKFDFERVDTPGVKLTVGMDDQVAARWRLEAGRWMDRQDAERQRSSRRRG